METETEKTRKKRLKKLKKLIPSKMFRLNQPVLDKTANIEGVLTHLQIYPEGTLHYIFQPGALNPENGKPVDRYWLTANRIEPTPPNTEPKEEMPDLPLEAFDTVAKDTATGFEGKVISFIIHPDGCVHVELQPEGTQQKTGAKRDSYEFDIRRLEGDVLKPMSDEDYRKSIKKTPSPAGMETFSPSGLDSGR